MTPLLIAIIVLALAFDYINGFHDAANSIATIVSTKVLTPLQAVVWAAFFNFVAFFIFRDHGVANTIAKTVRPEVVDAAHMMPVVLSGLIAAIAWNLLTWWFGIPSSSSHTLIGGFSGAAIAYAGFNAISPEPIIKTVAFIVLAPLVGMIIAFIISLWFINAFEKGLKPKIIALAVIAGVVFLMSVVLITSTSRVIGIKATEHPTSGTGILVKEVVMNSPAMKMGFKKDDVILSIDGQPVSDDKELDKALLRHYTEAPIQLTMLRDNQQSNVPATFSTTFGYRILDVAFYGENFKWLLMAFILISMSIFTMFLNSLNTGQSQRWFKRMQLVSSAAFSIGHGGNDAQKVMGIITVALIASGKITNFEQMPTWVPLACYTAIAAGTMSGGWKIIKTMGSRITKVTPFEGVAAETAGAITLFVTENLKIPVSTTHTITGSIIGVGATKRLSAVRWGVTISLLWAWILTIPVSAAMAALVYGIYQLFN